MNTAVNSAFSVDSDLGYAHVGLGEQCQIQVQLEIPEIDCDRYTVRVVDLDTGEVVHDSADLWTPPDAGEVEALATALTFLDACGQAYAHQMRHRDADPENLDLFTPRAAEIAYQLADDIALARISSATTPADNAQPPESPDHLRHTCPRKEPSRMLLLQINTTHYAPVWDGDDGDTPPVIGADSHFRAYLDVDDAAEWLADEGFVHGLGPSPDPALTWLGTGPDIDTDAGQFRERTAHPYQITPAEWAALVNRMTALDQPVTGPPHT